MIYPYAVLAAPPAGPLGAGLASEPLITLECGGLTVVAGEVAARPEVAPETLRAHDDVLNRLMRLTDAVLPLRFGQTVAGASELDELARPLTRVWREALARVAGCAQMTVRIFGVSAAPPDPVSGQGEGTRYLEARARAAQLPELEPLRRVVAAYVRGEHVQRGRAELLGSLYHLVERGEVEAYRAALAAASLPWRFTVTGPWAPYAFAAEVGA
jgi:hypothetical protein